MFTSRGPTLEVQYPREVPRWVQWVTMPSSCRIAKVTTPRLPWCGTTRGTGRADCIFEIRRVTRIHSYVRWRQTASLTCATMTGRVALARLLPSCRASPSGFCCGSAGRATFRVLPVEVRVRLEAPWPRPARQTEGLQVEYIKSVAENIRSGVSEDVIERLGINSLLLLLRLLSRLYKQTALTCQFSFVVLDGRRTSRQAAAFDGV